MDYRIDPQHAAWDYDPEYLLSLIMDIGEEMLVSGAEINRVEDTMIRICNAYGYKKLNVFSITEFMFVSILAPNGKIVTQTRRVYRNDNNLARLEQLNGLSRYICSNTPSVKELVNKISSLNCETLGDRPFIRCIAYMIGCGGFTLFFGGTLRDTLASAFIAILMFFSSKLSKIQYINRIVYTVICCFMASLAAIGITAVGFGQNLDMIMIGNIMLMIPGMALTNSIRDLLCGDIVAGLLRLIESILVALAIAVGFSIPMIFVGGALL